MWEKVWWSTAGAKSRFVEREVMTSHMQRVVGVYQLVLNRHCLFGLTSRSCIAFVRKGN